MKFFKAAKPLITWQEPRLFAARTRDRRGCRAAPHWPCSSPA